MKTNSLPELTAWIERVMAANHFTYEIIMVDDGSSDNSWALIETLSTQNKHIRAIKFRRNYGKSAALHCGFQNAQGDVVITMDADMQDSPDEIPALYQMIMSEDYDMISGWKKKRFDPKSKDNTHQIIQCDSPEIFRDPSARFQLWAQSLQE